MTNDLPIEDGLFSVKEVSRKLHIAQHLVREAVARGLIAPVQWNSTTDAPEWDYRFNPGSVEELGIWLRAQAHTELQLQDDFQFGVRKRIYNYNLRAARLKQGLTAAQLGSKLGLSGATVGQWENLRRFPSAMQRQAVADALGLRVDSLFPDWLAEFRLESGPSAITDAHFSLEGALAARLDLPSLPAPGEDALLPSAVSEVLGTLTDRERRVLTMKFGLGPDYGVPATNEGVGQALGVTRERIRQIEAKALRKLRHPTRARKLREFLE